ncbi:MAG: radical domain iron-sulfur cluster-binding oxidoreductase, and selenocysteine-containing [Deltaproteobacteria bacterium]|nr:radical domain iron-sulfur cluster-binding oxidoreductase, and selenocysteine-containing [Deltaproteobacteria bacterium]
MTAMKEDISTERGTATESAAVKPFVATLHAHGLFLVRGDIHTLQINTGFLCNQSCRHCHLEAGVISFATRFRFAVIDITGGAPEMVPDLPFLIESLSALSPRLMLRSNLTALAEWRNRPARDCSPCASANASS